MIATHDFVLAWGNCSRANRVAAAIETSYQSVFAADRLHARSHCPNQDISVDMTL